VKSSGKDEFAALVDLSTPVPSLPALTFQFPSSVEGQNTSSLVGRPLHAGGWPGCGDITEPQEVAREGY
jgi:hypothetical protein